MIEPFKGTESGEAGSNRDGYCPLDWVCRSK